MKRIVRFILLLVLIPIIIFQGISLTMFSYYFLGGWRNYYDKKEVEQFVANVQQTPALSDSVYIIYDALYDNRQRGIIAATIKGKKNISWQKRVACEVPPKKHVNQLLVSAMMFKVGMKLTPEKSFDYAMRHHYSEYCKLVKIKDTITNLSEREQIIRFLATYDRSYRPRMFAREYQRDVDSIKQVLTLRKI